MWPQRVMPAELVLARLVFGSIAGLCGPVAAALFLVSFDWELSLKAYALIGGLTGIIAVCAGVLLYLAAIIRGLFVRPVTVMPAQYQIEQARAHPVGAGEFPPDVAWPNYIFRQADVDRRRVRDCLSTQYRPLWKWLGGTVRGSYRGGLLRLLFNWLIIFLVAFLPLYFLLVAIVSSWLFYWLYWVIVTCCKTVNWIVFGAFQECMRTAETWRRERRRAHASCMNCFYVSPWPAYQCPGCLSLHHDVRPGRLGLFFRRCQCGTRFPTRASHAARHMTAVCKRCLQSLPGGRGWGPRRSGPDLR